MPRIIVVSKMLHHVVEMRKIIKNNYNNIDIQVYYEPDNEHCFSTVSKEIQNGAKIVICSDFIYQHYLSNLDIKVIPIVRNPYTFAKKIKEVQREDPRAVIMCRSDSNSFTKAVRDASELLGNPMPVIYVNDDDALEKALSRLDERGDKFPVIAPVWMHEALLWHSYTHVTIPFASDEFIVALNQAVCEIALMEEKEKFSEFFTAVLDLVPTGIICLDAEGRVTGINRAAKNSFRLSDAVMGESCAALGLDSLWSETESGAAETYTDKIVWIGDVCANATMILRGQGNGANSYVVSLSPVNDILAEERRIRRSLIRGDNTAKANFSDIVGNGPAMLLAKKLTRKYAAVDSTILITGPSGSGKEIFAQSIHNLSDRRDQPFVVINCAALPESLLESILFGYEKGSFTGAQREGKKGLFETAHKGTVFLDEISEMPLLTQARFLRVIQEREVMRVGSTKPVPIDVRIIAATNRDLRKMVEENKFRRDLYYRISVLVLNIPPLSERKEDIDMLAMAFLKKRGEELGRADLSLAPDALEYLKSLKLDGNVRELNNILERCIVMTDNKVIERDTVVALAPDTPADIRNQGENMELSGKLASAEEEMIRELLKKNAGNRKKTAEALGISTATLWRKMKLHEIA